MIIGQPKKHRIKFLKKDILSHRLIYYFFVLMSTVVSFLFGEFLNRIPWFGIDPNMSGRLVEDKIGLFGGIICSVVPAVILFCILMKLSVWACKKLGL